MQINGLDQWIGQLSGPQREAVVHPEGPLLVVAGAGSGKTRTLTARAGNLIQQGVPAEKILVATFTNRAAAEFAHRLEKLLGPPARQLWMGTLHSIGRKLLSLHGGDAGFDKKFAIYDTADSLKVIKQVGLRLVSRGGASFGKEDLAPIDVHQLIQTWKQLLLTSEHVLRMVPGCEDPDPLELQAAEIMPHYQDVLRDQAAMDFGDLIVNAVRLLERSPRTRRKLGLQHVLVDEYQDVDLAQSRMIELLLDERRNLTACGDVDQSIYRWRGAEPKIMLEFAQHYPGARTIALGQNYRSTAQIVDAAAAVIRNNSQRIDHRIWSENEPGYPIVVMPVTNALDEAVKVGQRLAQLHQELKIPWKQMAVLFRANHQSQALEQQLLNRQIPYYVVGSRFFDRAAVRDVVRYLRVIYMPEDLGALEDILNKPPRQISRAAWEQVKTRAKQAGQSVWDLLESGGPLGPPVRGEPPLRALYEQLAGFRLAVFDTHLPDLVEKIVEETGLRKWYTDRETQKERTVGTSHVDNLAQLLAMLRHNFNGLAEDLLPEFLTHAALLADGNTEVEQDAVQLMTLHAAKGTEFDVVLIVGVEEETLPHWRASRDPDFFAAIEEERRLMYVGMTRARRVLYLVHAGHRYSPQGAAVRCQASRFIDEIPHEFRSRFRSRS